MRSDMLLDRFRVHIQILHVHGHGLGSAVGFSSLCHGRPRKRGHIAVAGSVYVYPGRYAVDSVLIAHGKGLDLPLPAYRGSDKRMEQNRASRLRRHLIEHHLEAFRVEWCQVADVLHRVVNMACGISVGFQPLYDLLHDAADHLLLACMKRHHGADAASGQRPAQICALFKNQDIRSQTAGRDGSHSTGDPSASYNHIVLFVIAKLLHTFSFPVIITAVLKVIFITNHFFHSPSVYFVHICHFIVGTAVIFMVLYYHHFH